MLMILETVGGVFGPSFRPAGRGSAPLQGTPPVACPDAFARLRRVPLRRESRPLASTELRRAAGTAASGSRTTGGSGSPRAVFSSGARALGPWP